MNGALVTTLADLSIRALFAALLVGGTLAVFRVRAAAVRHASWTTVLVAMLFMPVLVRSVPAVAVPMWPMAPALTPPNGLDRHEASTVPVRSGSAHAVLPGVDSAIGTESSNSRFESGVVMSRRPRIRWRLVTLALYELGAVAMLIRFLVGWWGAARIAASAERISVPDECVVAWPGHTIDVRESRAITVPVTVGLLRQTVLLPVGWRIWPKETLRAVLAHELAHVRRRDLVVAFIAHLNRCLFWFHPLARWLERTLAATAEEAADEDAIAVLGNRTAYAEILLDMARAVTPAGGRVAWLGVGIGGSGSGVLHRRIACALTGRAFQTSRLRQSMVAVTCVSAILLAVACRPSATSSGEDAALEQRDRVLHLRVLQVAESQWRHFADVDWDAESDALAAHEAALARHPDDLDALRQFLVSYWARYTCKAVADCGNPFVTNKMIDSRLLAARRTSIVWLIEHHPESDLAGAVEARIFPSDVTPFFPADPAGYAQAKAAWVAQTLRPDVTAVVLGHAADFLDVADKPQAERMLLRARALNPEGRWVARLGRFYRDALLGSQVLSGRNSMRLLSPGAPSSYATALREMLATSADEELLTATAWFLSGAGTRPWVQIDPAGLAELCLTRALQINPRAVFARTVLLSVRRQRRNSVAMRRVAPADRDAYVAALSERQRFEELPDLAKDALRMVSEFDHLHDENLRGRFELGRDQAKRYAEDTLKLAPTFREDPSYGTAIYTANMTLSALALRDGDRRAAVRYLDRAANAPSSEELAYGDAVVWPRHIRALVAQGERQAAIAFLERLARTSIAQRIDLREWAAALRRS